MIIKIFKNFKIKGDANMINPTDPIVNLAKAITLLSDFSTKDSYGVNVILKLVINKEKTTK